MRPVPVVADSAGDFPYSKWVVLSTYSLQGGVSWNVSFEYGATGAVYVQASSSNPEEFRKARFTRSGTTLTIICENEHGLAPGDGLNIRGTKWDNSSGYSLQVTVTSLTELTVAVDNSGPTSGAVEYASIKIDIPTAAYQTTLQGSGSGGMITTAQMVRITGQDSGSGPLSGKVSATFVSNGF